MIGSLMMCVSVVVLFCGMVLGIAMGISEDFALQPAHAHLNLLGGVLMPLGVAVVITHGTGFIAIPILGSLTMLAATALFAVIVFRTAWA